MKSTRKVWQRSITVLEMKTFLISENIKLWKHTLSFTSYIYFFLSGKQAIAFWLFFFIVWLFSFWMSRELSVAFVYVKEEYSVLQTIINLQKTSETIIFCYLNFKNALEEAIFLFINSVS